uniref:Uncharacterized protein n=1 Tax=Candidatus Kentrum sp. MB TaxID=2138164 RepID=A0A450Y1D2_9GAMM|nr:MAG: hypothetical protein BECKMB1821G_GA0114241_11194 [Candidatus Kentron sp. MB]VFK35351.1 MAG: hypothetical protein BECKMB1821I_GA0114274_11137 [Candidatus Kentron sp. MB]VFK77239.1 MAG: hypothetical protein BECKMB1821H_GA0114242_11137 [Candidatus Kentron sp. MB]
MLNDEIAEIREIRHRISEECGHDIHKIVAYCQQIAEEWKGTNNTTNHSTTGPAIRPKDFQLPCDELTTSLADGEIISLPSIWSWQLIEAKRRRKEIFLECWKMDKLSTDQISMRISA